MTKLELNIRNSLQEQIDHIKTWFKKEYGKEMPKKDVFTLAYNIVEDGKMSFSWQIYKVNDHWIHHIYDYSLFEKRIITAFGKSNKIQTEEDLIKQAIKSVSENNDLRDLYYKYLLKNKLNEIT